MVAGVLLGLAVFDRLLGMRLFHVMLLIAGPLNEPAARWFTGWHAWSDNQWLSQTFAKRGMRNGTKPLTVDRIA
jgi:hypothetical protein